MALFNGQSYHRTVFRPERKAESSRCIRGVQGDRLSLQLNALIWLAFKKQTKLVINVCKNRLADYLLLFIHSVCFQRAAPKDQDVMSGFLSPKCWRPSGFLILLSVKWLSGLRPKFKRKEGHQNNRMSDEYSYDALRIHLNRAIESK